VQLLDTQSYFDLLHLPYPVNRPGVLARFENEKLIQRAGARWTITNLGGQSRNERLADLMRRLGICEEKGSGVDKVVHAAEFFQLPAPDFRVGERRTAAVLFAHTEIDDMDRNDRIRASYQHCCLRYVMNERMTNQSLRARFKLPEDKAATVSQIIAATVDAGKIKLADPTQSSTRYRHYVPFWA
jgi:ATP-dependent DNA helicase RecG